MVERTRRSSRNAYACGWHDSQLLCVRDGMVPGLCLGVLPPSDAHLPISAIQINLGRILAGRLSELEERFCEIARERVPKRLALTLIRLQKSVGKGGRKGVDVAITREELAQMTGTTLFTISRTLSMWAGFGFIVPRREGVLIADPDLLRRYAGIDDECPADCGRHRGTGLASVVQQRTRRAQ